MALSHDDAVQRILKAVGLEGSKCTRVIIDIKADEVVRVHVYASQLADEKFMDEIVPALQHANTELHDLPSPDYSFAG